MAHFDPPDDPDLFTATRAPIPIPDHPQIGEVVDLEVPGGIAAPDVIILTVPSHNKIRHADQGIIRDNPAFDADRPGKPPGRTRHFKDGVIHGKLKRIADEVISQFYFIDLLVTPHKRGNRFPVTHKDHGLDHIMGRNAKKRAHLFDCPDIRRMYLLQRKDRIFCCLLFLGTKAFRLFQVCGIGA